MWDISSSTIKHVFPFISKSSKLMFQITRPLSTNRHERKNYDSDETMRKVLLQKIYHDYRKSKVERTVVTRRFCIHHATRFIFKLEVLKNLWLVLSCATKESTEKIKMSRIIWKVISFYVAMPTSRQPLRQIYLRSFERSRYVLNIAVILLNWRRWETVLFFACFAYRNLAESL